MDKMIHSIDVSLSLSQPSQALLMGRCTKFPQGRDKDYGLAHQYGLRSQVSESGSALVSFSTGTSQLLGDRLTTLVHFVHEEGRNMFLLGQIHIRLPFFQCSVSTKTRELTECLILSHYVLHSITCDEGTYISQQNKCDNGLMPMEFTRLTMHHITQKSWLDRWGNGLFKS